MPLFALTIFASAFLLFLVQPIIAKEILPWFGGSAAVWTTCLVFFQSVLTAGYAYADGVVRKLAADGVTVLYISHFLEEVEQIASEYTVLRDGCSVAAGNVKDTTRTELVSLMAGAA